MTKNMMNWKSDTMSARHLQYESQEPTLSEAYPDESGYVVKQLPARLDSDSTIRVLDDSSTVCYLSFNQGSCGPCKIMPKCSLAKSFDACILHSSAQDSLRADSLLSGLRRLPLALRSDFVKLHLGIS